MHVWFKNEQTVRIYNYQFGLNWPNYKPTLVRLAGWACLRWNIGREDVVYKLTHRSRWQIIGPKASIRKNKRARHLQLLCPFFLPILHQSRWALVPITSHSRFSRVCAPRSAFGESRKSIALHLEESREFTREPHAIGDAPRSFAACSRVTWLASLAIIGELARRLGKLLTSDRGPPSLPLFLSHYCFFFRFFARRDWEPGRQRLTKSNYSFLKEYSKV